MSNIKIFVTHTPNRNTLTVENPLIFNVIAGSAFLTQPAPDGYYLDNTGNNISSKNKAYCELTTQYWAWKNQKADYFGFCHYRRFFNFNQKSLSESSWGTVEYDYLDQKAMEELHFNEKDMRECIEKYDFLIAQGVDASCMNSKTIYHQYENAEQLHIEDIDLLLTILEEKYTYLSTTARKFFNGKLFYPCNMFIMNKRIFYKYSEILFDILEEFEKRADISNYSREGYRTIGHLGERIASIYYLYLKEKQEDRLGELQIALIHHAENDDCIVAEQGGAVVPIVLAANQKYVPVLYTCLQSIIDHATTKFLYCIYIFHTDIEEESQKKFVQELSSPNIKLQFVNVGKRVAGHRLQAKQHITTETFYRFLMLDILKDYPKAVYLDCDMIICHDVAELYSTDLGEHLIAAVVDADFAGQCNMKNSEMAQYCSDVLKLDDTFQYFQAGVLVMNIQELRKITTVEKLLEMSDTGIYRFSDQDILNIVCKDRVLYLDMAWNMLCDCDHFRWHHVIKYAPYYILDAYEKARENPYIIHYAGFLKPWMKPDEDFADAFWKVARRTDYYEIMLWNMMEYKMEYLNVPVKRESEDGYLLGTARKIMRHFFPKDSKARTWAIKVYFKLKNIP